MDDRVPQELAHSMSVYWTLSCRSV